MTQLFTMDDVAERLHKSRRWLQYFLRDRAIGRLAGKTRLFTPADLAQIIQELRKSLGKGEVLSSILSGSTTKAHISTAFCIGRFADRAATRRTMREPRKCIRGKSVEFGHAPFTGQSARLDRRSSGR